MTDPTHRRPIGTSDLEVFPLALGGNVFGWTVDGDGAFRVLDAFTAAGGNLIDTADAYASWVPGNSGGESETIIGDWMSARGNRNEIVVATKVSRHPDFLGLSADNVRRAADASLRRLGTDRIDLYYAHFDDETVPIEESAAAMSALVDAGKVRYLALSNFSPARVREWLTVSEAAGLNPIVALQPEYNLVRRGFEEELRQVATEAGLGVVPYSALASGFLTGKYRDGAPVDSSRARSASRNLDDRGRRVLAALDRIASGRGTSVTAVSLAWLRQQPTVVAPIASARTVDQLPDLIAGATLRLSEDEVRDLDAASE